MPNLNERIRRLEELHPEQNVWDMIKPEQGHNVIVETIRCLDEKVAEGRGDKPWADGTDQTAAEALPIWRGYLADWDREHDLTH
jgi:hypothetical protein